MLKEQLINAHDLLLEISNGATVLTGNNRLANSLISQFDHYNIVNKQSAWSSPDIMPLNSWLIANWEQAALSISDANAFSSDYMLLNSEQEFQIWQAIVMQSSYGNGLLRTAATAKTVSDAWRLLKSWNLSRDSNEYQSMEDSKAFDYWCTEFEKLCTEHHWITVAQLASLEFYSNLISDSNLLFLGFDELTPQIQLLITNLNNSSNYTGSIQWLRQDNHSEQVRLLQCDDLRDEIESFAIWSKQHLEHNPSVRIALVVPDLAASREIILQTLERVLLPSCSMPLADSANAQQSFTKPWDISLGTALAENSIIKLLFQLLSIVRGKITMETISSLLRSPHITGASQEQNQRALLDRQLRELGENYISLKTVQYYCNQKSEHYFCPILSGLLSDIIKLKSTCHNKADSHQWLLWISNYLVKAGWASGRSLSSEEFQIVEAWQAVLQSFNSLQTVVATMTYDEVLSCLSRLASDKIFQIQSKSAAIQVLGLYESIGLDFDYLWVMNLHDEVWPIAPRANPFIPLHIQKKYLLPHASWQRELTIAKRITSRLASSAKNVVFSYPAKNATQECRPSPLISNYELTNKKALEIKPFISWLEIINQQSDLQDLFESKVVSLTDEKVSGGSSIFKNQSLCPFRAFVENRLHAKPMRQSQAGLDAMKRGSLLHAVLEIFWNKITTQQQLIDKSKQQLELIINHCIESAIADMALKSPDTFKECFTRIETQRLLQLVQTWLELEKQRAPFKVLDTEREMNITINGVFAHLFIDRVDELDSGGLMVIDYKTGTVSPTDWFGERPNDPQLPLYSIASFENLSAVLFAQIKAGELKFNGVVDQSDIIPSLPPKRKGVLQEATEHWPQVIMDWQTVLESLAQDFKQGHIEVDPKEGELTCRKLYCELSAVCRINELIENNPIDLSSDSSKAIIAAGTDTSGDEAKH